MVEKRSLVLQGYDRAVARAKELHKKRTGHEFGALTWICRELGISRQALDNWGKRDGFPPGKVAQVAELTGLSQKSIRPKTSIWEIPDTVWGEICEVAPKPLTDEALNVTNQRNRHG